MNVNTRLEHIFKKHGWTKYKLSKEINLPESTLSNILHRVTIPTIATLQTLCETLNITLSEFFSDDDKIVLTPELKEFYDEWLLLTPEKRKHIIQTMKYMKGD